MKELFTRDNCRILGWYPDGCGVVEIVEGVELSGNWCVAYSGQEHWLQHEMFPANREQVLSNALADVSRKMAALPGGVGVKVAKFCSDGTFDVGIVRPQDFVAGRALDQDFWLVPKQIG